MTQRQTHKPSRAVRAANRKRVFEAISFAEKAHRGQYRPNTELPYLEHLCGALAIAVQYGFAEGMRIAVVLHDIFEDTNTPMEKVEEKFGPRVVHLILACTDSKNLPWLKKKQKKLAYMKDEASMDELKVMCADKLHNIRSLKANIKRALEDHVDFWTDQFVRHNFDEYRWYYSEMALVFYHKRTDIVAVRMFTEFIKEVESVFGPLDEYQEVREEIIAKIA